MLVETLLWVTVIVFINVSRCEKHYIVPSSGVNTMYPSTVSYLTLREFATESGNSVNNDTELIFLLGNHSLDSNILFSNINHVSLTSINGNPLTVSINCSLGAHQSMAIL